MTNQFNQNTSLLKKLQFFYTLLKNIIHQFQQRIDRYNKCVDFQETQIFRRLNQFVYDTQTL
ncbi:hypothetical protein TTHERM_01541730 (macronuclear) [Tetrahymena thermophila SB210]|uniref:Uncharacterized protein n=1 Tax=Tetrahymena thermophila (strain SB210) TaxID=312017 RepID=Q228L5_TETTS|nr:hypothetical protein TTHERM_01541730 [Tetrahymena thermophila SB210]EAR81728.1 hypothetical protein TTHERM_01541730 [Tetrahymena thermophila SB210]|eukprot:XP_001029391.1 hypothetical protein TTHERM_01541730 [Tetrahymena thermophila SB210]